MSVVAHDIGPDVAELNNESIDVVCGNLGHVIPSQKELMMREGRRGRIGQLGEFKGGKTFEDTYGILARFDILEIESEEFLDRGPLNAMGFTEEIGKGNGT